jgi:hypothetical protein
VNHDKIYVCFRHRPSVGVTGDFVLALAGCVIGQIASGNGRERNGGRFVPAGAAPGTSIFTFLLVLTFVNKLFAF